MPAPARVGNPLSRRGSPGQARASRSASPSARSASATPTAPQIIPLSATPRPVKRTAGGGGVRAICRRANWPTAMPPPPTRVVEDRSTRRRPRSPSRRSRPPRRGRAPGRRGGSTRRRPPARRPRDRRAPAPPAGAPGRRAYRAAGSTRRGGCPASCGGRLGGGSAPGAASGVGATRSGRVPRRRTGPRPAARTRGTRCRSARRSVVGHCPLPLPREVRPAESSCAVCLANPAAGPARAGPRRSRYRRCARPGLCGGSRPVPARKRRCSGAEISRIPARSRIPPDCRAPAAERRAAASPPRPRRARARPRPAAPPGHPDRPGQKPPGGVRLPPRLPGEQQRHRGRHHPAEQQAGQRPDQPAARRPPAALVERTGSGSSG